jgi:hypothetical protein
MKAQIKILLETFKKSWLWITIFVILAMLSLLFYAIRPTEVLITENDFLAMISYPKNIHSGFICFLLSLYQIGITIYLIYIYYTYEFSHSFENIILRVNEKKWIFEKVVTCTVFLILIRLIYMYLIYLYFFKTITLNLNFIMYPVIYHVLISIILITIINFLKRKSILDLIIVFIVSYLLFNIFNILVALIIIAFLFIINFIFFHFKNMLL